MASVQSAAQWGTFTIKDTESSEPRQVPLSWTRSFVVGRVDQAHPHHRATLSHAHPSDHWPMSSGGRRHPGVVRLEQALHHPCRNRAGNRPPLRPVDRHVSSHPPASCWFGRNESLMPTSMRPISSTNGTFVNRIKVKKDVEHLLQAGDEITFSKAREAMARGASSNRTPLTYTPHTQSAPCVSDTGLPARAADQPSHGSRLCTRRGPYMECSQAPTLVGRSGAVAARHRLREYSHSASGTDSDAAG